MIKNLEEEVQGHFECLGEYTERYITFSVSIEKQENERTIRTKQYSLIV